MHIWTLNILPAATLVPFGESFLGFSEEARTLGFPSPSFDGFGFVGVASYLSIVAGWKIRGRWPVSALGH
jgi:hypothetical protein